MILENNYAEIDSLVDRVKAGDNTALWKLIEYYNPVINSSVNQALQMYPTVEKGDLATECIFIIKHLCDKYEKDKSYFSYFLNTRILAYLISKIKSKYINKTNVVSFDNLKESDYSVDYFDLDYSFDYNFKLQQAINMLPEKFKQAVDLFYFNELTQVECAKLLNITQPAFNKRLSKALEILRKNIS